MIVRILTSPDDLHRYEAWVKTHPEGSLWQSLEWKRFQEALGRSVRIYAMMDDQQIAASALVVIDRTSFGLSTWEVPRGPLARMENGEWRMENEDIAQKIIGDAKPTRCMSVCISPPRPFSILNSQFSISRRFVMPEATRILDLTLSDNDLLAQMKPKGRYNIRLAGKHGVRVVASRDVQAFARLADETARRDGFRGHSESFYERFLTCLPGAFLLLAYGPKEAGRIEVAGLLGVMCGTRGIYYYGASGNDHRELMAPYLLQWEAMRYCRENGCTAYDLFGITPPVVVVGARHALPLQRHPWASVSEFKAKFGGKVVTYPPEQEVTLRPVTKTLIQWKRKILG